MSKLCIEKLVELITNHLIEKKDFEIGLIELLKEYKIDDINEIKLINDIIKKIINNGYYIENFDPLKLKEI